jgi:hypothetical protein
VGKLLIAYHFRHRSPAHSNLTTSSSHLCFNIMPRTTTTAKMCTGGAAKRVTLTEQVITSDIEMQRPISPLNLQVSTHHVIEHL